MFLKYLTVNNCVLYVPSFNDTFHENDLCYGHVFQRKAMENCMETLIVKLLHATKDAALKVLLHWQCSFRFAFSDATMKLPSRAFMSLSLQVVNQAHICLTTVVTQFDPLRCLGVSLFYMLLVLWLLVLWVTGIDRRLGQLVAVPFVFPFPFFCSCWHLMFLI